MDGSELSHRKASRPLASCSVHKWADAREAQVSTREGRCDPSPGKLQEAHSGHGRKKTEKPDPKSYWKQEN